MAACVALLRAVNVGGTGKLPMADLRGLVETLGFADARTLLQSGNAVFEAGKHKPAELERLLEAETEKRLKVRTEYFLRTAKEWDELIAANPFPKEAKNDPARLHALVLKTAAKASDVEALQAAIKGREVVAHGAHHIYIYYPDGAGASKLTGATIERALGSRGTARNWNTVLKLQAMMVG